MRLKVVGKKSEILPEGDIVYISSENGELSVSGENEYTCDTIISIVTGSYFKQGYGFPVFKKEHDSDNFKFDPKSGRLIIAGYIDMSEPDEKILNAIRDNFRVSDIYSAEIVD